MEYEIIDYAISRLNGRYLVIVNGEIRGDYEHLIDAIRHQDALIAAGEI